MSPLVLTLSLLLAAPAPGSSAPSELIILLLVDAMRPDHLGAYGYDRPTSPNIDAIAQNARVFEHVYANAPWTRPSTASFLTGLNASRHRTETEDSKLPADVVTLAQRAKQAGYATAGFTANGNGGSLAGLERGFDRFEDPTNTYTKKVRGETYNGLPTGEFIIDKVLRYLGKSAAQKQLVFVFLVDPHDPYAAPPRLEKMFLDPSYTGPVRRHALWETNNSYPEAERRSMMAVYDAGIRYADEAIGQLKAGLERLGVYDRTTLLISADHGEGFGEHGFYLHAHQFWDEVVRIPLIAKGPRFAPGRDTRLAQTIDVSASIAELAGAEHGDLLGASLLTPGTDREHVISEYNEFGIHRQAITDGRYKVIWQRPADEAWFLRTAKKKEFFPSVSFDRDVVRVFDLQEDPGERRDLSAAMPAAASALLVELQTFVGSAHAQAQSR
ncbi:MAG: sulfatase [Myxococcota bacterium]